MASKSWWQLGILCPQAGSGERWGWWSFLTLGLYAVSWCCLYSGWVPGVTQIGNIPQIGLQYLNMWSPVGSTVWRGYGTVRKCSLAEGSTSLGAGLKHLLHCSAFYLLFLLPACQQNVLSPLASLTALCHAFSAIMDSILWNRQSE